MLAVISLLVVIAFSIIVTRVATIALIHTGLSREVARFQARSAFTGAGFTTNESEIIVNHPVRRRIVMMLMWLGNVGIVGAMSSLIIGFVEPGGDGSLWLRTLIMAAGVGLLWWAASSQWVDARLSTVIDWALHRYTDLEVRDYASLMHLSGDYRIAEIQVQNGDWLNGRTLGDMRLRDEGIDILAIDRRDGRFLGVPNGHTAVAAGDVLICYGRTACLEALDERQDDPDAERQHTEAMMKQRELEQHEGEEAGRQSK